MYGLLQKSRSVRNQLASEYVCGERQGFIVPSLRPCMFSFEQLEVTV